MAYFSKTNSYTYFDHIADIGIIGRGDSVEAAVCKAAEAMFAIMTDLSKVKTIQSINIIFDEADPELALVTWLNQLLAQSIIKNLALSHFVLTRQSDHWEGEAWGELWRDDLPRGTEVKGATLTLLKVFHDQQGWQAQCVVDV